MSFLSFFIFCIYCCIILYIYTQYYMDYFDKIQFCLQNLHAALTCQGMDGLSQLSQQSQPRPSCCQSQCFDCGNLSVQMIAPSLVTDQHKRWGC